MPLILIMQHHYINTGDEPVLVDAKLNMHRMEEAAVEHVATGFFGGARIELPPKSSKIVANTCKIRSATNLFAISSHSHERGACFTMNFYDGVSQSIEPDPFFVNNDWESPPILFFEKKSAYDKSAVSLDAGDGVHWACHYENPEDRTVVEGGSATDEMCIFVGLGYPSSISVQDIKDIIAKPSLDAASRLAEQALIPCDPVTDATSPWPSPNEVLPLDSGFDACTEYEPTVDVEE